MKAMILTAGLGTRMNGLSKKIPKPLLPVFNIPLIYYQLYQLKKVGVTDAILNLHHLGDKLKRSLGDSCCGIRIYYSEEKPKILGTGGGVKQAQIFLQNEKNFILLNSDFITELPLKQLLTTHKVGGGITTLLVMPHFQELADLNVDNKKFITAFTKKGKYMFCGVHILEKEIFNYLNLGVSCIVKDCYENILKNNVRKIKALIHKKPWHNFGTFDLYLKNQLKILGSLKKNPIFFKTLKHFFPRLKEVKKGVWLVNSLKIKGVKINPPVFIGKNVKIEATCTIGPHVIIGDNVIIRGKSIIKSSIVFESMEISKNSNIKNKIIF